MKPEKEIQMNKNVSGFGKAKVKRIYLISF